MRISNLNTYKENPIATEILNEITLATDSNSLDKNELSEFFHNHAPHILALVIIECYNRNRGDLAYRIYNTLVDDHVEKIDLMK